MSAEIWPVTEGFAAEVGEVDLAKPISEADWATIEEAYNTYSVLVFPDQHLEQEQHVEFARRFGPIDRSMIVDMDADARVKPEIADVSNLTAKGEVMAADNRMLDFQRGNRLWHTDSSFKTGAVQILCVVSNRGAVFGRPNRVRGPARLL